MKIAFTGSSGFIASSFREMSTLDNVEFVALKRDETDEQWRKKISGCDVVMNFAGAPVVQRWNVRNMQVIKSSRVHTTQRIVAILNALPASESPGLFVSASAIGVYPQDTDSAYDETSTVFGGDFLAEVVKEWEQSAHKMTNEAVRLVLPRIGVVLGRKGGMLKMVTPLFKAGLGGRLASGRQGVSFIHIEDVVQILQFFIRNETTRGVYNLTAPNPVSNAEFTKQLAHVLKRWAVLPVPAFAIRILFGNAAGVVTKGSLIYPRNLQKAGYVFRYDRIEAALSNLYGEMGDVRL